MRARRNHQRARIDLAQIVIPVLLRRAVLRIAAIVLFVTLAGATYQGAATAIERRQFSHPGRMVDIGDRQLHLLHRQRFADRSARGTRRRHVGRMGLGATGVHEQTRASAATTGPDSDGARPAIGPTILPQCRASCTYFSVERESAGLMCSSATDWAPSSRSSSRVDSLLMSGR